MKITPSSLPTLSSMSSTLSVLLEETTGGIIDDCMITRLGPESFYIVTNAGCRDNDLRFISSSIDAYLSSSERSSHHSVEVHVPSHVTTKKIDWEVLDDYSLLALQGPLSQEILSSLMAQEADLSKLHFGHSAFVTLRLPGTTQDTPPLLVSRGGYTGEDGFEISVPSSHAVALADGLLSVAGKDRLRLAGLGARDSLRLEAGMCLYGHDISLDTTPVEASLGWVVGKERRIEGSFNGAETILSQLKKASEGGNPPAKRRVGILIEKGAPAREGAEILGPDSEEVIGKVTSGCPSPSTGANVAMGYVPRKYIKAGTKLRVKVRGKVRNAEVKKMPFVESKYFRGEAGTTAPA